jgi:hypothetical protein
MVTMLKVLSYVELAKAGAGTCTSDVPPLLLLALLCALTSGSVQALATLLPPASHAPAHVKHASAW